MTACRDRHGCWGTVELMRDSDDPPFDEDDAASSTSSRPRWARSSARRPAAALAPRTAAAAASAGDADPRLRAAPDELDAALREWLAELPGGSADEHGLMLPAAVYEIGARRLDAARGRDEPAAPRTDSHSQSGRWAVIEGASLEGDESGRIAITVRGATTARGLRRALPRPTTLTRRERQLAALALEGLATKQLAPALSISHYTVQDHLKAIFAKTGVRSRRELVSRLGGVN